MTMQTANGQNGQQQQEAEPATAMVVTSETAFRREMEPHDFGGLYQVAIQLADVGLCGVKSPQEALVRMLTGRELGLTMMQAMRGVYVVEGNPSLSAALKQSICLAHPEICEDFRIIESDETHATYRVKRRGQPARDFTWTMEDAKRAGLIKKGGAWEAHPRRMLQARAKGEAADVTFGDLLLGFATKEEMEDVRATRVQSPEVVSEVVMKAAAPRDYTKESAELISRVKAAKTKEERASVRKAVTEWDGVSPHKEAVLSAYNDSVKAAKAAAAAPPAAAPPPAATKPAATPSAQEVDPETGELVPPAKSEPREPGEEG